MKKNLLIALFTTLIISTTACSSTSQDVKTLNESILTNSKTVTEINYDEPIQAQSLEEDAENNKEAGHEVYSFEIPKYNGNAYVELNNNQPLFAAEEITKDAFEEYSPLDTLGRCGVAYANVCKEIMPTEERGEIGQVKPAGWHTVKYNDIIDGNYLYNRCHLIAFCLAGENANEKNLITGTRYMNVQGMLPFEESVARYVDKTKNHVLYRVTPVYEGDNLIASGVIIEAFSVEDNGAGISFNVYCYNVQPGIEIDYATGDSWRLDKEIIQEESEELVSSEVTYVLNKNTMKFHYPYCSSVSDIKEKNKEETNYGREMLIDSGYSPCGRCNP